MGDAAWSRPRFFCCPEQVRDVGTYVYGLADTSAGAMVSVAEVVAELHRE
ncbi:hypothetical protein [Nocardia vermiculata]|uniref:Uncharacterized protein n=1 Tax=Nocardia vermiculata TaxID=257274 RepID=A0A846XVP4_9NOCA|nr:hypothetical protein [Nocardia vermiculata]NKY49705.1 hypothetical protein [Nocardia vermiculata]